MPRRRLHRRSYHEVLVACQAAAEMLKAAGFELRHVSRQTESCYYGWPSHVSTIRVAAHRRTKKNRRVMDNCIVSLTVSAALKMSTGGVVTIPASRLRQCVAEAIGEYFLRNAGVAGIVDAAHLKRAGETRGGANPPVRTNIAPVAEQQTHLP